MVDDKIANILSQEIYDSNKNLIDEVFENKSFYLQNNHINYNKLIQTLKSKSLLEFTVPEQSEVKVLFHIKNGDKKGFKILKNVLSNIGYSYYFTDFIKKDNDEIIWQIRFTSDYTFDSYNFNDELSKFQAHITDINRVTLTNWEYSIDAKNGILADLKTISLDEKISLPMPLEPYYLAIPNSKELLIASSQGNSWVPKISFYDNELNALGTIEMNKVYEGLKVLIPQNTKYIKISDRYSLLNIKRGLSVLVSNSLQN
ncbi:MAG: hypothetical protein PHF17_01205 [Arcobacteraceae bacterium]|nr:hypothetical protein [Arcobacteraceae bacterium]